MERMADVMKRKTYNNVVKATKMIQKKGYSFEEANEMAIRLFDENTKEMNSIELLIRFWIKKHGKWKIKLYKAKKQWFYWHKKYLKKL